MGNRVPHGYLTTEDFLDDPLFAIPLELDNLKSIEKLEALPEVVERGYRKGLKEVAVRMKEKCREIMSYYGLAQSEIYYSVVTYVQGDGVDLFIGTDYAIYVEFGTGLPGMGTHPKPGAWQYLIGQHIDEHGGWWYPTDKAYEGQKTKYVKGQLYAYTFGQQARPFVYYTWLWVRQSGASIIRKNIRRELEGFYK